MFKLPLSIGAEPETHEIADLVEWISWTEKSCSRQRVLTLLGQIGETDERTGCEDERDTDADQLDEVMIELERRSSACSCGYPFELDSVGSVLKYNEALENHPQSLVYRYLLLSTRLNMLNNKCHANIDGTRVFEQLTAEVLRNYLGANSKSFVFGTSAGRTFEESINYLCRSLGAGGSFSPRERGKIDAKDDALDAVAWIPFCDKRDSQLVLFGQCKTGTNWHNQLTRTRPGDFLRCWTSERSFLTDPMRVYCIAESPSTDKWPRYCIYGGLFFERCRVVQFSNSLERDTVALIKKWTNAACRSVKD